MGQNNFGNKILFLILLFSEKFKDDEAEKKAVEEELSRLKGCLDRAKNSIVFLKERERKLKDRYRNISR